MYAGSFGTLVGALTALSELEQLRLRVAELEQRATRGEDARRMLESVLVAEPALICHIDHEEKFLFVNRYLPGFGPETVMRRSVYEFLTPSSHAAARSAIRHVMRTREPSSFDSISTGGADGKPARYHTEVAFLADANGLPGVILFAMDVTARWEREQQLIEREAALRVAVEATGLGLWSSDIATGAITWNERMHEITGLKEPVGFDEYLTKVHPDDLASLRRSIRLFERSGVLASHPHRILRPDGTERWVTALGRALRNERGDITKIVGGSLDITAQRETENELQHANKMEAVGQLAAGIAHNFNNMLTAILPTLDLLGFHVPEEDLPLVEGASHAGRRAAEMVRQLMNFAGGRSPVRNHSRAERVADVVGRAIGMCRHVFGPRIRITESIPGDDVWLEDAGEVEQALVNILINARDALNEASQGAPEIRVEVDLPAPDDPEVTALLMGDAARVVRFRISDNGPGIAPEVRSRIFEPFYTTKAVGQGTGLGLSASYAIARNRGGNITCRSTVGSGAEFTVLVPIAEMGAGSRRAFGGKAAPRHETVAIVDDEAEVRRVIRLVLERAGHRVVEAGSVADAVTLLSSPSEIRLVLLDRSLPDGTGRQVLEAVPGVAERMRIVLFSGQDVPDDEVELAHAILAKPVTANELLEVVRRQLASS
jgi:PAS domain S-box-containing protein